MDYLDQNFQYGVIDNSGNKFFDSDSEQFQQACNCDWKLRSVNQILKDKIGHCYDQVEIEREWFEKNGYEVKTFWISAYQEEVENSGFSHTYLIYKENNSWKLFEHADYFNRGIYSFNTVQDAVRWQAEKQIETAQNRIKPLKRYVTCIKEYKKPPISLNMQEFVNFIDTYDDYVL